MRHPLRFREDGTFTIAQFTDTHWHNGEPADLRTRELIETVLDAEKPDLVALTGDNIAGGGCKDPAESMRQLVQAIEERRIPWAAVFGNHDDEGSLRRMALIEEQQQSDMCLSEPGPADVSGVGNYVVRIARRSDHETGAALYFIDSNSYTETSVDGYGWVRRDQVEWYVSTARNLRGEAGLIPALAFFHIPLPEYDDVWDMHPCVGVKQEAVCCPRINTGLFAAFHECGDVLGTFVGHDHVNDYDGMLHGIRLCYGRGSGFATYGREGFLHGSRIIRLREGVREFESWMRLEDGSREDQTSVHEPEGRPARR
ncbi:metallophosphoesterase [Candidatus Poribacteria bacterium]|nr:metallophosphoesterase [Candidatus Poribacteria bacterium]